jgi:hypothetical protein
MTNSKFANPQSVLFVFIVASMLAFRITVIGGLYLLAFGQMLTPRIVSFIRTQYGQPELRSSSQDLQSAFNETGIVDELRLIDKLESQIELSDKVELSDVALATEMVLGALKKPSRTKKKSAKIGSSVTEEKSTKVVNSPRKYMTAKEKQQHEAYQDRDVTTDWQDRDAWLGC